MGQMAIGVILGVKPTKAMRLWDGEKDGGAVSQFNTSTPHEAPTGTECGRVVGYFVTVHKDGSEQGANTFGGEAVSFAKLASGADTKRARKRWDRFAAWMLKRGVTMPAPELFMVAVDVG